MTLDVVYMQRLLDPAAEHPEPVDVGPDSVSIRTKGGRTYALRELSNGELQISVSDGVLVLLPQSANQLRLTASR